MARKKMNKLIGYYGLDCEQCDARIATVNNDDELRARTAKLWCGWNNTEEIKPAPAARGGTAIFSKRLELMKEEAARLGAIVHVEFAQNWNIRPCIGCMKCRSAKNCVLPEDDSQRVLPLIQDCAALTIGSPTYWGNMPVPLHKGKKAVVVCTSSTPWPFNVLMGQTGGVVRSIKNSYICTFTNQV